MLMFSASMRASRWLSLALLLGVAPLVAGSWARSSKAANTTRRAKESRKGKARKRPPKRRRRRVAPSALRARCGRLCKPNLSRLSSGKIDRLLRHLRRRMSYHQRLQVLSEMFLGTRYVFGPLGEGPKGRWDRDPIWRLDAVDCVTYVETVMALAGARSHREAKRLMQKIRYKQGVIRFTHRNHFTAAQWLPVNQREGYLRPVTRKVGGAYAVALRRTITPAVWKQRTWRRWRRRLPPAFRPKSYTIWYVPLRHIAKVHKKLPVIGWMGEIFDLPGNPVSVRHVGLTVRKRGKVLFRHANRPRVKEISLVRYARRHMWLRKKKRSRVIGFSFAAFDVPKKQ